MVAQFILQVLADVTEAQEAAFHRIWHQVVGRRPTNEEWQSCFKAAANHLDAAGDTEFMLNAVSSLIEI